MFIPPAFSLEGGTALTPVLNSDHDILVNKDIQPTAEAKWERDTVLTGRKTGKMFCYIQNHKGFIHNTSMVLA